MRFEFDWDPAKAEGNRRKHGSPSRKPWECFSDPLALSVLDEESGQGDERWVTIGRIPSSNLLLVVHTYMEVSADRAAIRIISARRPRRREVRQYE